MSDATGLLIEQRNWPDGDRCVAVCGEIDLGSAPALAKALADAIRDHQSSVVVDLSDVSFLDSSGINVLVQASALATRADTELIVYRPSRPCRRVLEVTGVDRLLEVRD